MAVDLEGIGSGNRLILCPPKCLSPNDESVDEINDGSTELLTVSYVSIVSSTAYVFRHSHNKIHFIYIYIYITLKTLQNYTNYRPLQSFQTSDPRSLLLLST